MGILLAVSLTLSNGCRTESNKITQLVGAVLQDVVTDGKSLFKIQQDRFGKFSWRIGLVNHLIRDENNDVSKLLIRERVQFKKSHFEAKSLPSDLNNIDITLIEYSDLLHKGFDYYSSDFIIGNNLDAIFLISDVYSLESNNNVNYINVCFFWKRNFRLIRYKVTFRDDHYYLGKGEFIN